MNYLVTVFGLALGLSLAAPPGPVNSVIASESLRSKIHGVSVGLGAMTADFVFFLLTLIFGNFLPKDVRYAFYLIGGGLMIWLAFGVLKSSMSRRTPRANYVTGLTMGLTNPFQITWWLTSGLFMIQEFGLFVIPGFFGGIVIWITLFPLTVNRYGKRLSRIIKIASFVILLLFGLYILAEGILLIAQIL
ncbi:LysE family transporter [Metallosphaera hakonensis]|uniref:Lysine transporter LysE n=2 Tax=Metallosphaera hakonensis TaxID=79601 RepID=A0A2U9IU39_9CREN|nr:LysE family transporter [Metallosphaera hakonensis]AWR99569.1 LysE family translocator [Metallosphaera hakonensis JCM 8857 = DSM 7519]